MAAWHVQEVEEAPSPPMCQGLACRPARSEHRGVSVSAGSSCAPDPWEQLLWGSAFLTLNTQAPDKPPLTGGNPMVGWACIRIKRSKCPEIYFGLIFQGTAYPVWCENPGIPPREERDGWEARACLSGCLKGLDACAFLYDRAKPYIYIYINIHVCMCVVWVFFPAAPSSEAFPVGPCRGVSPA